MNTTLDFRKSQYLLQLQKEYAPKEHKWWHPKTSEYNSTSEIAHQSNIFPNEENIYTYRLEKPYMALIIISSIAGFFYWNSFYGDVGQPLF